MGKAVDSLMESSFLRGKFSNHNEEILKNLFNALTKEKVNLMDVFGLEKPSSLSLQGCKATHGLSPALTASTLEQAKRAMYGQDFTFTKELIDAERKVDQHQVRMRDLMANREMPKPKKVVQIEIEDLIPMLVERVIFNPPATVVIWKDGDKTVVKSMDEDKFEAEIGLAMAFAKKFFGSRTSYKKFVRKWDIE